MALALNAANKNTTRAFEELFSRALKRKSVYCLIIGWINFKSEYLLLQLIRNKHEVCRSSLSEAPSPVTREEEPHLLFLIGAHVTHNAACSLGDRWRFTEKNNEKPPILNHTHEGRNTTIHSLNYSKKLLRVWLNMKTSAEPSAFTSVSTSAPPSFVWWRIRNKQKIVESSSLQPIHSRRWNQFF